MPNIYQSYNAFVSSPGDVEAERQMAEETIRQINRTCVDTLKLSLEVKRWENLPPLAPKIPEERIQDVLDKEVKKAHFFILILYKRYGSIEPGHSISNTEREINTILERYKNSPKLKILAYFREIPQNEDPGEQEEKVQDLKQRLQNLGIIYKGYNIPEEFKELFTHDLYNVIFRMQLSTYKHYVLNEFWQFGITERPTHPQLVILYPAVQRDFMGPHRIT